MNMCKLFITYSGRCNISQKRCTVYGNLWMTKAVFCILAIVIMLYV